MAWQFSLSQVLHCLGFHFVEGLSGTTDLLSYEHEELNGALRRNAPTISSFKFERSCLATVEFEEWWSGHFAFILKPFEKCFLEISDSAFFMQTGDPETKMKGTHYSGILNFENYF